MLPDVTPPVRAGSVVGHKSNIRIELCNADADLFVGSTHQQLGASDQERAGVTPGYVRLSVGIEHPEDILRDLEQALERSARRTLAA